MARTQRHTGTRRHKQKLRAGLEEGSIVYGELVETERVLTEASESKKFADKRFATKKFADKKFTTKRLAASGLTLRQAERGRLCFFPVELPSDASAGGLRAGDVVRARLFKRGNVFYARALESLGRFDGDVSFLSTLSLQQLFVRTDFSSEVLAEAASLAPYAYEEEREDARALDFVTIDGEQARDFDDAVQAEACAEGGWLVRVAIADVAHYVREGSRLDEEARLRGNSRYLTDRVVPMLPPRLSEDLCSLRAGEDRPCLMAEIRIDAEGRWLQSRFARVAIRVRERLTYEAVQNILDRHTQDEHMSEKETPTTETQGEVERAVLRLYGAWRALAHERAERGALEIVREEHAARLKRDGKGVLRCVGVSVSKASAAHRLIEDTMILANMAVAEHLAKAEAGFVARAHEPPSLEKWQGLEKDLAMLGLSSLLGGKAKDGDVVDKAGAEGLRARLHAVLTGVSGKDEHASFLASEAVLRAQSQARYIAIEATRGVVPEARGEEEEGRSRMSSGSSTRSGKAEHFALALGCYCHFTSPIRRYADLCVHRALLGWAGLEEDVSCVSSSLCEGLVANERSAISLERVVFQRMVCACLSARQEARQEVRQETRQQEEEIFEGAVVKVMGFGFFVRLLRWNVEGVVMRRSFEQYRYARVREEADADGLRLAFGVRVRVRVKESDAVSGRIELELSEVERSGRKLSQVG